MFNNILPSVLMNAAAKATEEAEDYGTRIFDIDAQLFFDAAVLALNIFLLFILLSYLLFNPVRDMLKKRQEMITNDRESAIADKEDAALRNNSIFQKVFRRVEKNGDGGGIVLHAGTADELIVLLVGERFCLGKNGIRMRRDGCDFRAVPTADRKNGVLRLVNIRAGTADALEKIKTVSGARIFHVRGRGDAAQRAQRLKHGLPVGCNVVF